MDPMLRADKDPELRNSAGSYPTSKTFKGGFDPMPPACMVEVFLTLVNDGFFEKPSKIRHDFRLKIALTDVDRRFIVEFIGRGIVASF